MNSFIPKKKALLLFKDSMSIYKHHSILSNKYKYHTTSSVTHQKGKKYYTNIICSFCIKKKFEAVQIRLNEFLMYVLE